MKQLPTLISYHYFNYYLISTKQNYILFNKISASNMKGVKNTGNTIKKWVNFCTFTQLNVESIVSVFTASRCSVWEHSVSKPFSVSITCLRVDAPLCTKGCFRNRQKKIMSRRNNWLFAVIINRMDARVYQTLVLKHQLKSCIQDANAA